MLCHYMACLYKYLSLNYYSCARILMGKGMSIIHENSNEIELLLLDPRHCLPPVLVFVLGSRPAAAHSGLRARGPNSIGIPSARSDPQRGGRENSAPRCGDTVPRPWVCSESLRDAEGRAWREREVWQTAWGAGQSSVLTCHILNLNVCSS